MEGDRDLKLIDAVLHRFSLEQLVDIVFPEIKILSWPGVQNVLVKGHLPLNKDSVIRVMLFGIKEQKIEDETYATQILQIIQLLDIAVHHYRLKWIAFMMTGETGQSRKRYFTGSDVQDGIETIFSRKRRLVEVSVILQDEICWISLVERKHIKNKGLVYKAPIFVAHFPGQPYFFISHSRLKEDILHVISRTFGYADVEECDLSGQNVRHLYRLLKNRESDASSAQDVLQEIRKYRPVMFEETPKGIDFTQHKRQLEYADVCFGSEPTLQQLSVKCSSCQWTIGDIVPETEGKSFGSMEVSFQSPDIMKMFREMTVKDIFTKNPPTYICNLQKMGKNKITIGNVGNTTED